MSEEEVVVFWNVNDAFFYEGNPKDMIHFFFSKKFDEGDKIFFKELLVAQAILHPNNFCALYGREAVAVA
jgi:hypothetical protein